jgi:hypothetical protein
MSKAIPFRGEATVTLDGVDVTLRLSLAEIEAIEARDSRGLVGLMNSLANVETAKITDAVFVIGHGMIGAGDKLGIERAKSLAAKASLNELVGAACSILAAQFRVQGPSESGNAPAPTETAAA